MWEKLGLQRSSCFEKERVRSKVTPRKVGVGLKRRREPSRRRLGWRFAWWGSIVFDNLSNLVIVIGKVYKVLENRRRRYHGKKG